MSRHHLRNFAAPSSRESAKRILEGIDEKNRNKRLLGARLQKLAGFGRPPQRVIDAFRAGEPAETKMFKTDGKKLIFNGHEVARHTKNGLEVSYAGYDSSMTSATLRALGVDTRKKKGITTINGKEVDPESKDFHFVPKEDIVEGTFVVNPNALKKVDANNRKLIDNQEIFRKKVRKEFTGNPQQVPLDPTAIQPDDQREINRITGIKSKIPKETLGPDTHHILPKSIAPGLKTNTFNGIPLSKKNHRELHGLNPNEAFRKMAKIKRQLIAERLKAFTNTSSFVGNMRYDQDEQSMTGILSGKHYKWCNVPEKTFDAFQGAGSAGAFFNRQVKGQFDCNSGGRLNEIQSRISKLQKTAGIKPLVRKKKKGKAIKKIAPRVAMVRTARHMSASELAAKFRSMTASNPDILKQNGTFDPLEGKIIDASTPEGAIRLQNIFESHGGKIGLNSITDTRQNIVTDMDLIESQLLEIEQAGGIPAIGVFDGSLEATNVLVDKTDDEIIANLGEAQRSTAIIDPDTKLRIVDNPRFKQN